MADLVTKVRCETCGVRLVEKKMGRPARFCSSKCRVAAHRARQRPPGRCDCWIPDYIAKRDGTCGSCGGVIEWDDVLEHVREDPDPGGCWVCRHATPTAVQYCYRCRDGHCSRSRSGVCSETAAAV